MLAFVPGAVVVDDALASVGFRQRGRAAEYHHVSCRDYVEFPGGPLAIGDEAVTASWTLREGEQLLHVLSSTDSCRDRLAAFYHWSDQISLRQAPAVALANANTLDLAKIEAWSIAEGHRRRFDESRRAFDSERRTSSGDRG